MCEASNVITNDKTMNYENADIVLQIFYKALPYGKRQDEVVRDLEFGHKEKAEIIKYLSDELIIVPWEKARNSSILTRKGEDIIKIHGGIEKYLENEAKSISEQQSKVDTKEQLETELAKSNIDANKLNAKIALQNAQNESKNRIAMWINIAIGVLNAALLAWSIMKG